MAKKSDTKRQHILTVAAQAFQELGFERTTMSEICARMGGSKATLYNYFPSKEVLFFEIMYLSTEAEFQAVHSAIDPSTDDIVTSLQNFGERLLTILYSPQVRANRHLSISESGHSELGRLVLRAPGPTQPGPGGGFQSARPWITANCVRPMRSWRQNTSTACWRPS